MPRLPEATIEDVRSRADIVEVVGTRLQLQRRGSDYWACCPFHQEKTPSFKVSSSRQSYYCFGCHQSGNVFTFVQQMENLDFVEAVRFLARRYGIVIPEPSDEGTPEERQAAARRRSEKEQSYELLAQMARWYQHRLTLPDAQAARDYVAGRGLDAAAVEAFGIGYAPDAWDAALRWCEQLGFARELALKVGLLTSREEDPSHCYDRFRDRLMFPICDEHGRVVGFSGRILQADAKTAKYVNSPESDLFHKGRLLYGFHLARAHFREHGQALICEGQLDVIACHRAGLDHAVCSQGTAFTEMQAQLLRRSTEAVTLAFDGDAAGIKAAVHTLEILQRAGLRVKVAALPEGEDPDGLFRRQGPAALRAAMDQALDGVAFVYHQAARQHDAKAPQGKAAVVQEVLPAVLSIDDPVARAAYADWLASQLQVPPAAVVQAMQQLQREQSRLGQGAARAAAPVAAAPATRPALPAFEMPRAGDPALVALLDLAVHFECVAQELLEELPPELIPEVPVGQALNVVLAQTAAGEWSHAADALTGRQDLVVCPEVNRVVLDSAYKALDPEKVADAQRDEAIQKLHQAASDCVVFLRLAALEQRLRQITQDLAAAEGAGEPVEDLMQLLTTLSAEKRTLVAARRAAQSSR
ncbi:MAG: DNA primase [Lentisphaerae bacterium]|nr:DNA primase [Lentisphaerota bacterium]